MLTFKPPIGTYVDYEGYNTQHSGAYLITEYKENIATITNMTTMKTTCIIVKFFDGELNNKLTVVA